MTDGGIEWGWGGGSETRRAFFAKATKPKRRGVATRQAVTSVESGIDISSRHRISILV
jgi:hypothetical protein